MRVNIVQGTITILKKLDSSSDLTTCFLFMGAGLSPTLGVQPIIGGSAHHGRGGGARDLLKIYKVTPLIHNVQCLANRIMLISSSSHASFKCGALVDDAYALHDA